MVKAKAVKMGIDALSFMGKGKNSTVIAIAAPNRAIQGAAKNEPAREANRNLSLRIRSR
jgi:hypothetical protein